MEWVLGPDKLLLLFDAKLRMFYSWDSFMKLSEAQLEKIDASGQKYWKHWLKSLLTSKSFYLEWYERFYTILDLW